jgi:hypothetical protein
LHPASLAALVDAQHTRASLFADDELPRLGRRQSALPLLVAALIFLGLAALYGATFARSAMEHPRPLQVDPATLQSAAPPRP